MKRFKRVYIEITNVCNLDCSFCPRSERQLDFMSSTTFQLVLDQVKPYTDYLYFHVKGEPLLHPQIGEFLDFSNAKDFKVNITTNGTLISDVKEKLIGHPALRQINFSLHSFDGNSGLNNKDEYITNIIEFAKQATKVSKVIISFRFWNLEESNRANIERKRNRELLQIIERAFKLPYSIEEKGAQERGIKIAENIYLNQDYEFKWPDMKEKEDREKGFCYGLRSQIAVLVDGTVVPCCMDGEGSINLGNIKNQEFSKILESDRVKNIVNGFLAMEVVEELCRKCSYRKRFRKTKSE